MRCSTWRGSRARSGGAPTRALRAGALALLGAALTLCLAAPVPASIAASFAIPEGAAVRYACTQADFEGPFSLRCPLPYTPLYASTFLRGFQRLTPENEFKMLYLEPSEGHFDFATADALAAFARANGKTIRGHTLIWADQEPWWLRHPLLPWSDAALTRVMQTYITTVVTHFATAFPGTVTEWDVVNEPLTSSGQLAWSPWEAAIGPDYIRLALEDAHAADPSARLVINEEADDLPGAKAEAMLALASALKATGAPLDAVGFEAHVTPDTAPTLRDLVALWTRYRHAGLEVEVTELDVGTDPGGDTTAQKNAVFERYAQACRRVGNCVGYTVWGVADPYSWLGAGSDALLYDAAFRPTAAVPVVRRLLERPQPARRRRREPAGHRCPARRHVRRGIVMGCLRPLRPPASPGRRGTARSG